MSTEWVLLEHPGKKKKKLSNKQTVKSRTQERTFKVNI